MLSPEQAELVHLIQQLHSDGVQRVLEFARKVKSEAPLEYTDDWTEEELRAMADATLRRLDEVDPYDWPTEAEEKK